MESQPETDDLLVALDPEQRAVATTFGVPVCVIAGAGTGKTRAITHRIAHGCAIGAYDPLAVLAVTFTTRAAGELRGPAARPGPAAGSGPNLLIRPRCVRPNTFGRRPWVANCRGSATSAPA